ncbi:MAG: hypothetical protein QOH57_4080 [Mycobacterium sp.]|nr:hypothetical protein [Mycobacterium sp.]
MDAFVAGRLTRTLDPLHSVAYFLPATAERFGALGMQGMTAYFAARSAPMGAVVTTVVTATFYNFNQELIAASIPAAWDMASPQTVTDTRYQIVEELLPSVLGEDLARSAELSRAADVLCRVAEAIPDSDGRPLYAGHAELPWPTSAHSRLWHAVTLLREYRGDGHIAALVTYRLSGIEALITHTASGIGFTADFARRLRGWSEEQWAAAVDRLRHRGVLDHAGALTSKGIQLRTEIEDLTDRLASAPWKTVTERDAAGLDQFAGTARQAILDTGLFPPGAFAPRWGAHR